MTRGGGAGAQLDVNGLEGVVYICSVHSRFRSLN